MTETPEQMARDVVSMAQVTVGPEMSSTLIFRLRRDVASAISSAISSAVAAAREEERETCAKLVEGDLVYERYRTWPCWNPNGNLGRESGAVKLTQALATAIRSRNMPNPDKGEVSK